nr:MAG TPA: hypothetical protein [Caudoviricetes sp.]
MVIENGSGISRSRPLLLEEMVWITREDINLRRTSTSG